MEGENSQQVNISITYETLFEMIRLEKTKNDLQKLSPTFFADFIQYFKEKNAILRRKEQDSDLFNAEEIRKLRTQIENIIKLFNELYTRRERKIVDMALNKVKTNSDQINLSTLLKEERIFYDMLVERLNLQRKEVLNRVVTLKEPDVRRPIVNNVVENEEKKIVVDQEKEVVINQEVQNTVSQNTVTQQEKIVEKLETDKKESEKLVRFISAIPKFLGPELEVFGPFFEEDMVTLPTKIADILIKKGRAEEITMA